MSSLSVRTRKTITLKYDDVLLKYDVVMLKCSKILVRD
jgi:hypothetical protein